MARASFGGGASDFTFSSTAGGIVRVGSATLTMWDSETDGARVTDLVRDGEPVDVITVGSDGKVPTFQGPDGTLQLWADAGSDRVQLVAQVDAVERAEAAAAAAEAVGASNDAIVAALVPSGSGSATAAALGAQFDPITTAAKRAAMNAEVAAGAGRLQSLLLGKQGGVFVRSSTPTANRTTTTLAATAASGSATLSLTAQLTPGRYKVDAETVTINAVTGSGPYTATLSANTTSSHASGATIATTELDYELIRGIGDGRYVSHALTWKTNNPSPYTHSLNQLGKCRLVAPMLSVHISDAAVTRAGTWSSLNAQALAYGLGYRYSTDGTTPATASWTSPANSTMLGVRVVMTNTGGLAKVTIGGSTTAANLLPTAAQVVAQGLYPNTILVANGGTLNPTDRVLNTYASSLNYDVLIAIAEGLAPGAQAVVLTTTGYIATGGTLGRTYLSGFASATAATTIQTANIDLFETYSVHNEASTSSAWEYADEERPAGVGTLTFIGSIHGYERQDSLALWLGDASASSVLTLGAVTPPPAGGYIKIIRTSTLFHPDLNGGATPTKTCVTTYTLDRLGLQVESVMTWLVNMEADLTYAMMPLNGVLSTAGGFDRAGLLNLPESLTFPGSSDTRYGRSKSGAAWCWQSSGKLAALMWLPDTYGFTEGWTRNEGVLTSVQDRTGTLTKVYAAWLGNRGGAKTIPAGTVKTRTARYLVAYCSAGAESVLSGV